MGEVCGDPTAIEVCADQLRQPLGDVVEAVGRVESRAHAYVAAPTSAPATLVTVPVQLDDAIPWVRELAATLDQFADQLVATDRRLERLDRWIVDPLRELTGIADQAEAGAHLVLTPWRDAWRHARATFRHWRLQDRLATASDWGTGLPRRMRRSLMRDHNRGILNRMAQLRGEQNATRVSVAAGRAGSWTVIRRGVGAAAARFPRTATVARAGGRFLGAAGIAISTADVVIGVREGDVDRVVAGAAGLGAVAAFAVGGPVGIAVGVALVAGSLAWQHRDVLARRARALTDGLATATSRAATTVGVVVDDVRDAVGGVVGAIAGDQVGGVVGGVVGDGVDAAFSTVGGWFD